MNKYIIEDNISFFEEINNLSDVNEESLCLISKLPLDDNKITLPCGHSFNFIPLYKDIIAQKSSYMSKSYSKNSTIQCPYCRQLHNQLLPHIKLNDSMKYIYGVNTPACYSMNYHTCKNIIKSGKNKGKECSKIAFYKNGTCLCSTHHKLNDKKLENKKYICKAILKSGKNKGKECGCKVSKEGDFCKRHSS